MRSEPYRISPMSRNPGLNRGPTDYEAVTVPSAPGVLLEECRSSKHDFRLSSTTRSQRNRWFWLLGVLALAGCRGINPPSPERWTFDACLQRQIFTECLAHLPAGPGAAGFNDWDDVVDSCRAAAREQSSRACSVVAPECQTGGYCVRLGVEGGAR